jgi:large subunit ribosomal protein L3
MKFILGTKVNMTQIFADNGQVTTGTLISALPMKVTQIKSLAKDKYESVQVGSGEKKSKNVSKAVLGHLKTNTPSEGKSFRHIQEFRMTNPAVAVGDVIDVTTFTEGDTVSVAGISKSKGFQGVVKRHGFHGGRRSHGQKHSEREPGSIGATAMQRVLKGMRMGGRMGGERISVSNLKIVKIDKENNQILVSGAIPGRRGTLVEITSK